MILGIGTDLTAIGRFERLPDRFFDRVYTPDERTYCEVRSSRRLERYASRWAAKEAVAKALGTAISAGIRFHDIEILPASNDAPVCHLRGAAQERFEAMGAHHLHISLTHEREMALAMAVLEG